MLILNFKSLFQILSFARNFQMTDRVNELAAVSLRKPVKIFVDSNKTVAWNLQQEFVRVRPSQEAHQVITVQSNKI